MKSLFRLGLVLLAVGTLRSAPVVPYVVPTRLPDAVVLPSPSAVHVDGWLGQRIDRNASVRLLHVDTVPLLAGYKHKPGEHPWIGEHVGKWLHAATLAWDYTGDAALRQKLDAVVTELIAAQESDGYLGTYVKAQRFGLYAGADWDVWSHKYNLIGLLTYYRYTGNAAALQAARRAADLLLRTFPQEKSILAAGTHLGMAATSVLEPIVELYRLTGDERYLAFARYIVRAYDEPGGPAIVKTLLRQKQVNLTANGKAYEMLSNLVGLAELARVTGDRSILTALMNAWTDIVDKRLYLTGTSSCYELFGGDHELPNGPDAHLGETCVTVTWIQFNRELLILSGEARFADEIERSLYNHLAAAQNPRGDDWCYYTPLEGVKPYDQGITCCHSSGPRGFALAPTTLYFQDRDSLYVSTFESSRATLSVDGEPVELVLQSEFPAKGRATLTVHVKTPHAFGLAVREPTWAAPVRITDSEHDHGWVRLPRRTWKDGDTVAIDFTLQGKTIAGQYTNYARTAFEWGPFVLAADKASNPSVENIPELRALRDRGLAPAPDGALAFTAWVRGPWDIAPRAIRLVPYADAGANGSEFRVWLRTL